MKIYNFICKLKGKEFKYKVEALNEFQAKVKLREHIKNAVEIQTIDPQQDKTFQNLKNIFGI